MNKRVFDFNESDQRELVWKFSDNQNHVEAVRRINQLNGWAGRCTVFHNDNLVWSGPQRAWGGGGSSKAECWTRLSADWREAKRVAQKLAKNLE